MKEGTVAGSACNISQVVITMSEAELACKLLGKLHMLLFVTVPPALLLS